MSIADSIAEEWARDDADRAAWALGEYVPTGCESCGRMRVCKCPNGKHRCEKCNWVPEDQSYCPVSLR